MSYTLIKGGYVYDPKNGIEGIYDVLIHGGRIQAVEKKIEVYLMYYDGLPRPDVEVINAKGFIVCPGWIDFHVHCFEHATPLGINADETCLRKGVTTVVDAGSTGASTFLGLKKYVMENSKTRVKAFLHIASHGLASAGCTGVLIGGECDSLNQVNVEQNVECIKKYSQDIIGIKVRLAEAVCDDGRTEVEVYQRALKARELTGKPLMVHHAYSSIPIETTNKDGSNDSLTCPGSLNPGDVYTHAYHSTIVKDGTVHPEYIGARKKGVIFDLGHGAGSFDWKVAEICSKEKFWPDIISTDLHTSCSDGPAYDLPTVMSKLLHLGMPLSEIIKAVTSVPAKVMRMEDSIGSLTPDSIADVTMFEIRDVDIRMEDCHKETKMLKRRIKPIITWRAGVKYNCT